MNIQAKFDFGQRVIVDGDPSIKGTITAVTFRANQSVPTYEVSFIHNGAQQTPSVEEYRLEPAQ